ncbi:MAG: hypothetical protein NVSMB25_09370 [Thermoleophilaceae bacterium]
MRPARVSLGSAIAALGALVLLVSLFLSWYEPGLTAWTVFETMDLVLAAAAIATIAAAAGEAGLASPLGPRWLPRLGVLAFVIVAAALINHPPAALGHPPEAGIWIALLGSSAMLLGGLLIVARVSLAVNVVVGRPDPGDSAGGGSPGRGAISPDAPPRAPGASPSRPPPPGPADAPTNPLGSSAVKPPNPAGAPTSPLPASTRKPPAPPLPGSAEAPPLRDRPADP